MKRSRQKVVEEKSVVDRIEGFGEIAGGEDGPMWRFPLVEAFGDVVGEREEGSDTGATRSEAMLMRGAGERLKKLRADEALENFGGRTEERYWAVGGREFQRLARFGDGNDKGVLPNSR